MIKVAVIGAGTMGNGIAHLFAMNGFKTALIDISPEALERATATVTRNLERMVSKGKITQTRLDEALSNIETYTELALGVADAELVVEAATENEEIKSRIFSDLENLVSEHCILASNTSSISITRLSRSVKRRDRIIGMHFFNPVPIMQLVELIRAYSTSDEVAQKTFDVAITLGKTPVIVKDYPGFVSNRILMPMINEAISVLREGIAGVAEIDTVMKLGMSHPMGPLLLADFIGLDVCLDIMQVLQKGFGDPKYAPNPLLVNMVQAGHLGKKSGEGFYDYSTDPKKPQVSAAFN